MAQTFYSQILHTWNWDAVREEAENNPQEDSPCHDFDLLGYCYLGSVFSVMPSGKYYTAWACSNATEREAERDERYMEALEKVARKYGGWIEPGEGDPCDLFFVCHVDKEEEETEDE